MKKKRNLWKGELKILTSGEYLKAANAIVERIDVEAAIERRKSGNPIFIDVQESAEITSNGTIAGALHIPHGFIEFAADESVSFHNKALSKDQEIILVCGAGGMAAMTGNTMIEKGLQKCKEYGWSW